MHSVICYSVVKNSNLRVGQNIRIQDTGIYNSPEKAINFFVNKELDDCSFSIVELKIYESEVMRLINSALLRKRTFLLAQVLSIKPAS